MNPAAADSFERSFLSVTLSKQISDCDSYELAPLFLKLFSGSQPVLEAGCGSGRWCGWLRAHGIAADGIDWSNALCERAAREIPGARFYARDMSDSGLPDGSYGGLLALGSIEHTAGGPARALTEFYRLLRPGGVALITVPYGGWLRRACHLFTAPVEAAKGNAVLRRLSGRPSLAEDARTLTEARLETVRSWHPRFALGPDGWSFYEYEFRRWQLEGFLVGAGFVVRTRFVGFVDEGLLHTFGRVAGRWNERRAAVDLTWFGKVLRAVLPAGVVGHMLCYVVARGEAG